VKGTPKGLLFPDSTIGSKQKPWKELLDTGVFPNGDIKNSWMVGPTWRNLLENSYIKDDKNPWTLIHLGNIYYEEGQHYKALESWEKSLSIEETPMALRNIATYYRDNSQDDKAINYMLWAVKAEGDDRDFYITVELFELLLKAKQFSEVWETYINLPSDLKNLERIIVPVGIAAFELKKYDFLENLFKMEFAFIQEGETRLFDLWNRYCQKKYGSRKQAPKSIDFSMV